MPVEDLVEPVSELWRRSFERSLRKWGATKEREFGHKKANRFFISTGKNLWKIPALDQFSWLAKLNIFHPLTSAHLSPKIRRAG